MNYEDFCAPEDVEAFLRVKRTQQRLARVSREVVADMVGGTLGPDAGLYAGLGRVRGKELLRTEHGLYRLASRGNSDNTTERAAHDAIGASTINMGDDVEMVRLFTAHGLGGTSVVTFKARVWAALIRADAREDS